ncbi:MAG: glycoside hydrolase [Candidatus Omnitrophica bacterium]|nr:glycoside hydrolase [Candidatus Omnitrophota bacterium]
MADKPLYIAFIWHMHQPYYKDPSSGEFSLPWVRLHGIKDYLDMVTILEEFPDLHQTFNIAPSLIEQLNEYARTGIDTKDKFLILSKKPAEELTSEEQEFTLSNFFMANWEHMIRSYPRYYDLLKKRGAFLSDSQLGDIKRRFNTQDYLDLQVLFNLAWFDISFKEKDPFLKELVKKGSYFTEEEKKLLLNKQMDILKNIIPTYKRFQDSGQIEVSISPYFHPILPLLCDTDVAKISYRDTRLPNFHFNFPEDAKWHIENAVRVYKKHFSKKPKGMWPSEGSVSEEILPLVMEEEIEWLATDEEVLFKSLSKPRSNKLLFKPYKLNRGEKTLNLLFRDRALSDLVGFVYSHWQTNQAIDDFLKRLHIIKNELSQMEGAFLVPIILDGENAWEYYPNDGRDFLYNLYKRFSKEDSLKLTTISEFLENYPPEGEIKKLFPGSWIDANFNIWIGHEEKNKAWDYLYNARDFLVKFQQRHPDFKNISDAWKQIYIAEGSDWNWWFGDDHSSGNDEEFDRLFRENLKAVYTLLEKDPPEYLNFPIKSRVIKAQIEPSSLISPHLDGMISDYFEWLQAGFLDIEKLSSAMHRPQLMLKRLYYGFDLKNLYLRFDLNRELVKEAEVNIILDIDSVFINRFKLSLTKTGKKIICKRFSLEREEHFKELSTKAKAVFQDILEFSVDFEELNAKNAEFLKLHILIEKDSRILEEIPDFGYLKIVLPGKDYESFYWYV